MRLTVQLFFIYITIFGSQICYGSSLTSCVVFLEHNHASRVSFKSGVQKLLDAGRWLRTKSDTVNPRTTHLAPFASVVIELKEKISATLPTKTGEHNYSTYEPLLRDLMKEIENHVKDKKVTYEWLSGLSIRIGFLLKMDGTLPMFLRKGLDPDFMFDPSSYATHQNFLQLLLKAKEHAAKHSGPSSVIARLGDALQNFPQQRMVPYFGGINVRELNHLVADETWPIGISSKQKYVDSVLHDEFAFPLHDVAHASLRYEHLYKEQISSVLVNSVERDILQQIESSSLSDHNFNVQHFLHFVVFHEGMASDFTLRKDGRWTVDLTRQTMKEGFTYSLGFIADVLIERSEGLPHLYDDLRRTVNFSDDQKAQQSIRRNISDYIKKIEAAVDRHLKASGN